MLCYRSSLSFSLLFSFIFFAFSHGDPQFLSIQTPSTSVMEVAWRNTRSLVENLSQGDDEKTLLLVAERTRRKDPLNNFQKYTGGWNISDKHYWASVGFTAFPMFAVAAIWYVGFGLCLLMICFCYCCCPRPRYGYSRGCYVFSLILLLILTIFAILGCIALYAGQWKFNATTTKALSYVVHQAEATAETLRNVSDYLAKAAHIKVQDAFLPPGVQNTIAQLDKQIAVAAEILAVRTADNSGSIQHVLNTVRLTLVIVAAVMLALALLGFLFSIFGVQCLIYTFVILGWVLVAGTFILSGVFLLLHNVAGDTCLAMDEWIQNPTANTSLDDILPCVDTETAQDTLSQAKEVSYQLVSVVNLAINLSNFNSPFASDPLVPLLCNPFLSSAGQQCPPGAVDIQNATQEWKKYICKSSNSRACTTKGHLPSYLYNDMTAAANVIYGLYHYTPFLVDLVDCKFVRETFASISKDYCDDLRSFSAWIYIGLAIISAAVMLSLFFWIIHGREQKHRYYTKLHRPINSQE